MLAELRSQIREIIAKHFTWADFLIGGTNMNAGFLCLNAAINNYLYYDLSLRLAGIIAVLTFTGAPLVYLEIFPRPDSIQRNASHLNSFTGRSISYYLLALLTADSITRTTKGHKISLWAMWVDAGSLILYATIFAVLALSDRYYKKVPLPKSMKCSDTRRSRQDNLPRKSGDTGGGDDDGGWTVSKNDDDFGIFSPSIPYGDPFDQASTSSPVYADGWTHHPSPLPLSEHQSTDVSRSGQSLPLTGINGVHYTQRFNSSDTCLEEVATFPSLPLKQSRKRVNDERFSKSKPNPNRIARIKFAQEASASREKLLPTTGDRGNDRSNGGVALKSISYNPLRYGQSRNQNGSLCDSSDWLPLVHDAEGYTSGSQSQSLVGNKKTEQQQHDKSTRKTRRSTYIGRATSRKHKRVFMAGVGSFDLSSGSESEENDKEEVEPIGFSPDPKITEDDSDSVYSLDSTLEGQKAGVEGTARLGRKLSRKETKTYRQKLNRGMQRALEHADEAQEQDSLKF